MPELKDAARVLDNLAREITTFKTVQAQRLDDLQTAFERYDSRLKAVEMSADGLANGARGGTSGGNAEAQRKALRGFLESKGAAKAAPDDWLAASSAEYQQKAMTVGTDADGGFAVPEILETQITRRLAELSPIRQVARVLSPATSFADFKIPISLGGVTSGWVSETSARPDTATSKLTVPSFPAAELYAMPKISGWLQTDFGAGSIEQFLGDEVAEQFALQEGVAFVSGDASSKPKGFLHNTPVVTGDSASPERGAFVLQYVPLGLGMSPGSAINPDQLIELAHTLKSGYWANASWLMSRATIARVRRLKNSTGDYLWRDGLMAGQPPQLLGFPVLAADAMPAPTAGAFAIALGDWRRAYCVLEKPTRLLVDPYTDKPNVRYYWTKRCSGHPVDSQAAKVGRLAAS